MKNDIQKTIHYTTNAVDICKNLLEDIPKDAYLVEPFVGKGDLVKIFPSSNWEIYDVDNQLVLPNLIHQNTLIDIPDYSGKWVITNPPFLAKNKAQDKTLFEKHKLDDLYKIAMKTIIGCEGGLLIIPINFFTDENSRNIRNLFLSQYKIVHINFFLMPVFETTTYSVCAFTFVKEENECQDLIGENISLGNREKVQYTISKKYDYRLGGEFFQKINETKTIFDRLTEKTPSSYFITNMNLIAMDTRKVPIHIELDSNHFMGKPTDRTKLTFTSKIEIPIEKQEELVKKFNNTLSKVRKKYHNMLFTNYRDFNRKRIGFDFAYKLLTYLYQEKDIDEK